MPLNTLSAGQSHSILEDVVYALPPSSCFIHSSVALELSVNGTDYVLTAATTTGLQVSAMFVRCTTAAAVVSVKRY
jgi:hypothetical protein